MRKALKFWDREPSGLDQSSVCRQSGKGRQTIASLLEKISGSEAVNFYV